MPLRALQEGLDWSWTSFGEWLGRLDGRSVSTRFLGRHSAFGGPHGRHAWVRSPRRPGGGHGRGTSPGADRRRHGFSTSKVHTHHDGDGRPVPSRAASEADRGPGPGGRRPPGHDRRADRPGCLNGFSDEKIDLMTTVSLLADRPVNWNRARGLAMIPPATEHQWAPRVLRPSGGDRGALNACRTPCGCDFLRARGHPRRTTRVARDPSLAKPGAPCAFSDPEVRRRMGLQCPVRRGGHPASLGGMWGGSCSKRLLRYDAA